MTAIDFNAELLEMRRRKSRGDSTPGPILGINDAARECGIDVGTLRRYLGKGIEPDWRDEKGAPYFARTSLSGLIQAATHLKATNIAVGAEKVAKLAASRPRDEHGRLLPKHTGLRCNVVMQTLDELSSRYPERVVRDEGKSLPAASIGGEP